MADRFIDENQEEFGLRWLLRYMKICPNAYYNYVKDTKAEYRVSKAETCQQIKDIYHECSGSIGHRTMCVFLARKGIILSKITVHKYKNKELQLHCVCRRKKPGYKKGHKHKIFSNLLKQNFEVKKPNQVWCTDFTYLFLSNGSVRYNCSIIDLHDRGVVSSENGGWITSELAITTIEKALKATNADPESLILHSDQGSQFTFLE